MSAKVADLLVILFFALIIALVFQQIATSMTEQDIATGGPYDNAASYPRSLAILLGVLLIGYLGTAMVARRKAATARRTSSEAAVATSAPPSEEHARRGVILLIIFAVYLWLLPIIGYHLATPLMLGSLLLLAHWRHVSGILAFSVSLSIGISFVFEVFLKIVLPGGQFGLNIPWPSF